jgi:hypothetical protein
MYTEMIVTVVTTGGAEEGSVVTTKVFRLEFESEAEALAVLEDVSWKASVEFVQLKS